MEQKYVIAWRSLITGFEGQGTGVFDRDEAQRYANDLNLEYTGIIHHWPKAVAPETVDTSDLDTQPITPIVLGE